MSGVTVYVVWHRAVRRGEWVRVGTATTRRGALELVTGPGDWWVTAEAAQQ